MMRNYAMALSHLRRLALSASVTLVFLLTAPSFGPGAEASSPADGNPVLTPMESPLLQAEWYRPGIFPPDDYQDAEYFLDGFARTYPDGETRVPYRTRIFVRRPADPATFSGTVLVEFNNPTLDQTATYPESWQEIHRRRHAYVMVSGHAAGVEFLKQRNPVRYDSLDHPGNDYAYDMYSQAGWVLKYPGEHDPLAGLRGGPAIKLIGIGQSGSGSGLVQYIVRGALRDAAAAGVYDALMPGDSGGPVTLHSPGPPGDEIAVPVLHHMAESQWRPNAPEHPLYKPWWIAGASHKDHWNLSATPGFVLVTIGADALKELAPQDGQYGELGGVGIRTGLPPLAVAIPLPAECLPANMFPKRYAIHAAIRRLDTWIRTSVSVPDSPEFEHDESGLVRDADGNVLGGLRLAPIDVPVAGYDGESCSPWGLTTPFSDQELRSRYPTHDDYMTKLSEAIDANVADGFLLPEDADDLLGRADAAWFRWGVVQP